MLNPVYVAMLLSNPFRPDPRVLKEAESLSSAGFDMTVICWDRLSELPSEETLASGVKIVRIQNIPSTYGTGARQILRLPAFWHAALKKMESLKPVLVHCHDFDTLPAGLWWGWQHGVPVVYDAHEYYAELVRPRLSGVSGKWIYEAIRRAEIRCASHADAVITVDETLGGIYRQRNSKVLIVGHYPSINLIPEPAEVFTHPEINLLYVGRLSTDRGALVYARLLRNLLARGVPARLHLAGRFIPAAEREAFNQEAQGLEAYIHDHGWVTYDRLPGLLGSVDVGLAVLLPEPRYVAALPVKLFEYMAAGLPVIASNFPSIREVVSSSDCGLLVDPLGDLDELVANLAEWWRHPDVPRSLGRAGRRAVQDRYNWENLTAQLDRLYHDLTAYQISAG
jgi:glycosyltransferase involved in cell wall biosynthesis